jgi:glucose/mannose-6-phosphate isomerase
MDLQPRLSRYDSFLRCGYLQGFTKGNEYRLDEVHPSLPEKVRSDGFKTIVFTGMGCSAIVSDLIRGYMIDAGIPVNVYVVNDYDFRFLVPSSIINDDATLIVISSYSGYSTEPILALEHLLPVRDRVLLLTSGGRLAELGRREGVSTLRWALSRPDREYPLFHVTQYLAILLTVFAQWGLLGADHLDQLAQLGDQLAQDFDAAQAELVKTIAESSFDANITMIAAPKWHESLLKLCKMHLNEIAMVPATRNYIHEFCHSEVASLSNPSQKHSILLFSDSESDEYTKNKEDNLVRLLTEPLSQNRNIAVHRLSLTKPGFLRKFFGALTLIQEVTLAIGKHSNTVSRELISEAAQNTWYHSSTILAERTNGSS